MKKKSLDYSSLSFELIHLFQTEAKSIETKVSMAEIQATLSLKGFPEISDKTIRKYISLLKEYGYPVQFDKTNHKQGYYMAPLLHPGETFLLIHALRQSNMLMEKRQAWLEEYLLKNSPLTSIPDEFIKKKANPVSNLVNICLKAIQKHHCLQFHYFDYDIHHQKQLRRNGQLYRISPYALHIENDHYYVIGYFEPEQEIRNYRLDKMLHLQEVEFTFTHSPFDLIDYLESNFHMFKGEKQLLQLKIKKEEGRPFLTDLFERFESITVQKSLDSESHQIALKTAISPPLIAWLMQQHSWLEVLSPQEVRRAIEKEANFLLSLYSKKGS